jgi:hypothetical protein
MRRASIQAVPRPGQTRDHAQEDQEMFQHGCPPCNHHDRAVVGGRGASSRASPAVSAAQRFRLTVVLIAAVAFNDFSSGVQEACREGSLMAVYLAMTAWSLGSLPPSRTCACLCVHTAAGR